MPASSSPPSFRETHKSIHGAWFRSERRVISAQWLTYSRKEGGEDEATVGGGLKSQNT